ncbi:AraC family transcriptional regulator [Pseudonocardia sp. CA-142604]
MAASAGSLDLSTFERAFRRQYGTSPAAWRREYRHPGSPPPLRRNCLLR